MDGVSFSFFLTKISCTCCGSLLWGCGAWCGVSVLHVVVCLVGRLRARLVKMHPFWAWIAWAVLGADGFGWFLSFPGLLSGQSAMSGAWPWISLGGPGEGLGASLIISLMLCNYITFQNCR